MQAYSIDPQTRYKNIPYSAKDDRIVSLYDTDNPEEIMFLEKKYLSATYFDGMLYRNVILRHKISDSSFEMTHLSENIRRLLIKKSLRARFAVLEKMGKTMETRDEILTLSIEKFKKQREEINQISASIGNYINRLKKLNIAEVELMSNWSDNINDWENLQNFHQNAESIQQLREEGIEKLGIVMPSS